MGYLATEIIVLLGGAAALGLVIGWALFGLGKKSGTSSGAQGNPKLESELKAERDARKKSEGRIVELEAKESNFNERLQERDAKVAELSHQLDDLSKYRVQSAAELDSRDQRILALEGQLRQRDADLYAGGVAPTSNEANELADRDRLIATLKANLEAAQAAASPEAGRVHELERENAELRQTLIATDGAAPTTSTEKDGVIARLNEEVTGLRAAYESAEQALEEQDAAIDKLTRDLQASQHKLAQLTAGEGGKPQSGLTPISTVKPRPDLSKPVAPVTAKPEPAKVEAAKPQVAAKKAEPAKVADNEATMAVSLADLVDQIDTKSAAPASSSQTDPTLAMSHADLVAYQAQSPATPPKAEPPPESEKTVAVSLADLVGEIDRKAPPAAAPAPEKAPAKAQPAAKAPPPVDKSAPKPPADGEATVAVSLADLVGQIDEKTSAPPASPAPAKFVPAAAFDSEATQALSLDSLVAQIDAKPAAAPPPKAEVDANESTVAISLADLVGQIDASPSRETKLDVKPAPPGAQDDLKQIRGIGSATEKRLNGAGIKTWTQMAGLAEHQVVAVADLLKISPDRIKREQWVEQARALSPKA